MKKYRITDADGEIMEVEEIEATDGIENETVAKAVTLEDLLAAINNLAAKIETCMPTSTTDSKDEDKDKDEKEKKDACKDEDPKDKDEDEKEDKDTKAKDSADVINAIKKNVNDSKNTVDNETEAAMAWQKWYEEQTRGGKQ